MKSQNIFSHLTLVSLTIISNMPQLLSQTYYWEAVQGATVNGDTMCYAFSGGLPSFYNGNPIYEWSGNPTFFDIDNDGDLDFFFAGYNSNIAYYENTNDNGTNSNPCWDLTPKILPGVSTPVGQYGTLGCHSPFFADIDGDGEFDLISSGGGGGGEGGTIYYFRDTVVGNGFYFVLQDTMLTGINAYDFGALCAQDVDNDGNIDIVIGDGLGDIYFCRGKGNNQWATPALIYQQSGYMDDKATPTLGDLDNDGLPELLVGMAYGNLRMFKIDSISSDTVIWKLVDSNYLNLGFNQIYPYTTPFNTPILVKFSGDSLYDLFVNSRSTRFLSYYKNIGTADSAVWDIPQNFQFTIDVANDNLSRQVIDYADINGNGLKDIVLSTLRPNSNYSLGNLIVYENQDNESHPNWVLTTYNLLGNLLDNYTYINGMCFYDVLGDSLPDLFLSIDSLNHEKIILFQNNSVPGIYQFDYVYSSSLESIDSTTSIEIGDINLNGKPDLLVTIYGTTGNLQWYEKSGDEWMLITNDLLTASKYNYAEIADFDFDGLPDVIATDNLGNSFYKNLGINQNIPVFERQPSINYFHGVTSLDKKPIWGNIDGKCGNDLIGSGAFGGIYVWGFRGIKPTIIQPLNTIFEICDSLTITLTANPLGGIWEGYANSNGTFVPSDFSESGDYRMIYSYTDPGGCYTKKDSLIISITECIVSTSETSASTANIFSVFPNPTNEGLFIKYSVGGVTTTVSIYLSDIMGLNKMTLFNGVVIGENNIFWPRPTEFPSGIYLITFSTDTQRMTQKVIVK